MNGATHRCRPAALAAVPTSWSIVGQRDFDGDGKADLLWRDTSGNIAIWFMNGTQSASTAGSAIADDLVGRRHRRLQRRRHGRHPLARQHRQSRDVADERRTISQSGRGLGNVPATWTVVGTGDFNGDGKTDILWRDTIGNTAIWFMNGRAGAVDRRCSATSPTTLVGGRHRRLQRRRHERHCLARHAGNTAIWLMNGATVFVGRRHRQSRPCGRWR